MGGFLRAFIPLGESAGDYLQQRDIAKYGDAMRQRRTDALADAFRQLGPEGETLAGEIGRGLPPEAAGALLPILQKRQFQKQLSEMLQKSGGKITPEIYAAAQEAGVNLGPLMKSGQITKTFQLGGPSGNRVEGLTGGGDIIDIGAAPSKATTASTFMDTPIVALKGKVAMDASGNPVMDQTATVGDVIKSGGRVLDVAQAKGLRAAIEAKGNLQQLLDAGKKVLPSAPKGLTAMQRAIVPAKRYLLTKENVPDYVAFEHSKAGLITYLRQLAQVGRMNQQELQLILNMFDNANTQEGLEAAVGEAQKILDRETSLSGIGGPEKSVDLKVPGITKRKHLGWAPDGREVVEGANGKPVAVNP